MALLEAPAAALLRTLGFCSPCDWGRLQVAHRSLRFDRKLLLLETLGEDLSSLPTLGEAARQGLLHVVLARLLWGADPNERDKTHPKYTPLHRATSGGHRSVVRLLLSLGANVHARDRLGFCALHFAANQSVALVADLIAAGCDVHAANLQGVKPLHSSAGMGRADICEALLAAGARVCASGSGATPAHMARRAAERRDGAEREACLALAERLEAAEAGEALIFPGGLAWAVLADGSPSHDRGGGVGKWLPFDPAASAVLDEARSRGLDEVQITVRDTVYLIDLGHMTQTNAQTGTVRRIAQLTSGGPTPATPWVPAAPGHWDGLVSTGLHPRWMPRAGEQCSR